MACWYLGCAADCWPCSSCAVDGGGKCSQLGGKEGGEGKEGPRRGTHLLELLHVAPVDPACRARLVAGLGLQARAAV
jgi:hypothetical protein